MSQHPANLILRFALEIAALVVVGQWGWQLADPPMRYVYAFGLPVILAVLWAVFKTPNEPGFDQKVPIPVPGRARLAIEAMFFGFAVWTAFDRGQAATGLALILALLFHYALSLDRVAWLWNEAYYRKESQR